jgi:hypothetical protein
MRLHRHDDPILRPGTRTGKGTGRTPDYDPHHGRRPAQEPTPRTAQISQQGLTRGVLTPDD